jgi:hypothetical protein
MKKTFPLFLSVKPEHYHCGNDSKFFATNQF